MNPSVFDSASILDALNYKEERAGRVRGDDVGRPVYFLEEIPVPEVNSILPEDAKSNPSRRAASFVSPIQSQSCPSCRAENQGESKFCAECGHRLDEEHSDLGTPHSSERKRATLRAALVSINEDGTDGHRMQLEYTETILGRNGDIRFPTDAFLSPKHARILIEENQIYIEDLYSLNGTYMKLREEKKLSPGDTFLMGRQVLRFERFDQKIVPKARSGDGTRYMGSPPPGGEFKLLQVGIGGVLQNTYCLPAQGAIIGREKGDVIFPQDKFMSSRHAQIFVREDGNYYLVDINSSNGTWVKIWEKPRLSSGDFVFIGQQLFRIDLE